MFDVRIRSSPSPYLNVAYFNKISHTFIDVSEVLSKSNKEYKADLMFLKLRDESNKIHNYHTLLTFGPYCLRAL